MKTFWLWMTMKLWSMNENKKRRKEQENGGYIYQEKWLGMES